MTDVHLKPAFDPNSLTGTASVYFRALERVCNREGWSLHGEVNQVTSYININLHGLRGGPAEGMDLYLIGRFDRCSISLERRWHVQPGNRNRYDGHRDEAWVIHREHGLVAGHAIKRLSSLIVRDARALLGGGEA